MHLATAQVDAALHGPLREVVPLAQVLKRSIDDPVPDRDDQASFFGERHELVGLQQPPDRMVPPHQRLVSLHRAGLDRHDGLVVQREFAAFDRDPQLVLGAMPIEGLGPERLVEHRVAAAPLILRCVHRDVGVAEQRAGRLVVEVAQEGDADAGRGPDLVIADREAAIEAADDAFCDRGGVGTVLQLATQDNELVAAESGHEVAGPDDVVQALGDPAEELVAVIVAERVVDDLELVEVEEEDRSGAVGVGMQRTGDGTDHGLAVREPGERVVVGLPLELGLERLALPHVARDARDELRLAGCVAVLEERRPHRDRLGAGVEVDLAGPRPRFAQGGDDLGRVAVEHVTGEHRRGVEVAQIDLVGDRQHPSGCVVRVEQSHVAVGDRDHVAGCAEHGGQPLGALFGVDAFGDVADVEHEPVHLGPAPHVRAEDLDPGPLAVAAADPNRHPADRAPIEELGDAGDGRLAIVGMHEIDAARPDQVGRLDDRRPLRSTV